MSSPLDSPGPVESRRVVITQSSLFSIGGSEMVAFELAEYFSSLGDDVMVITYGFGRDWADDLEALNGVIVMRFDDPDLDRALLEFDPTIVWVHHEIVPAVLMRAPQGIKFVFHHMSITHPMEFPIARRLELALASAIVFVSPEALEAQVASGTLDGVPSENLRVFGNPAPRRFLRSIEPREQITSILLVSNHAPGELSEALGQMSSTWDVVSVGANTELDSRIRRIEPSDFDNADAVITIGKTVQFALVTGTPVYCYDHFGGPGWLTESNFPTARFHNFSGRGFEKKSPALIREELVNGYPAARQFARGFQQQHADEYRLDIVMETLLESVSAHNGAVIDDADITSHQWEMELRNGLINTIEARSQTIEHLSVQLALASAERDELRRAAQAGPSFSQRLSSHLRRAIQPQNQPSGPTR